MSDEVIHTGKYCKYYKEDSDCVYTADRKCGIQACEICIKKPMVI